MSADVFRLISLLSCTSIMASLTVQAVTLDQVDAVVVFCGQGELQRIRGGVWLAERYGAKHLIIIGWSPLEAESQGPLTMAIVSEEMRKATPAQDRDPSFELTIFSEAENTKDQARIAMTALSACKAKTALLVATGWHLIPRAYLTFVGVALRHEYGGSVKVWPMPADRPLSDRQEGGRWTKDYETPLDAARAEAERCLSYEADVVTLAFLNSYLTNCGMA